MIVTGHMIYLMMNTYKIVKDYFKSQLKIEKKFQRKERKVTDRNGVLGEIAIN